MGARMDIFAFGLSLYIFSIIWSSVCRVTALPVSGEYCVPHRANNSLKKSYISVTVPTVERGLCEIVFCSIDMDGESPSILSTSGLSIPPMNCLAYADSVSMKRLCPSAYIVSNASDDLPEPESPVNTINESLGRSTSMFLRLCTRAPFTTILSKLKPS